MALFIGYSHVEAIIGAAEMHGLNLDILHLWTIRTPLLDIDEEPRLNPAVIDRLKPVVFSLIGGVAHDRLGLFQHPDAFDFILPEQPDLPMIGGARIIPYSTIAAAVEDLIIPEESNLANLIAGAGSRVIQIESPPPCAAHTSMADGAQTFAFLWGRPSPTPSSAWLRYKLWRVHSAIIRQRCEANDIEFLPAPRGAFVDDRFLATEFYRDPCHANASYGALVLRQLDMFP